MHAWPDVILALIIVARIATLVIVTRIGLALPKAEGEE